jgi:DNA repair protein RadA/Sms
MSEEEQESRARGDAPAGKAPEAKAYRLDEIDGAAAESRDITGIPEFDRALGGGLVKGSLVLVGGDPGIGKSTLLLQMCASNAQKTLYVSGEESVEQLRMRAHRLGVRGNTLLIAAETRLSSVERLIKKHEPDNVIIDSIQTIYDDELNGAPGGIGQIRGVTASLMRMAKMSGVSFIIVGHVTKDGAIAGPKVLEHMVDTVLYFEGEKTVGLRLLRAVKNRFGPTNEIGVFEMTENGLAEVVNPSALILSERPRGVPGSVVVPSMEGTRSMLVEIQALASRTNAQIPRRMASGVDYNRMTLMIAILEKRLGLKLFDCDVYVNVTGGLKLFEPACDLGIIAAVSSSFRNKAPDPDTVIIGEVGLTGEIRGVDQLDKRLNEAARLGFLRCVAPESNLTGRGAGNMLKGEAKNLEIIPARHIIKVFDLLA